MQFLKDEVRNAIVSSALAELTEKGYGGASMRAIAQAAGITAGNIYRYFETKDSLFNAIMEPVSRQIMELVHADRYRDGAGEARLLDIDAITQTIMSLCREHAQEVFILLFKSEGSAFADIKGKLIELIALRVAETMPDDAEQPMAPVLSAAFVEGLSEIFKMGYNETDALEQRIRSLILFFFRGPFG